MTTTSVKSIVEKLFEVGAHYGYSRSRRHPSAKSLIFGAKSTVEIFDLEKTVESLEKAKAFVTNLSKEGRTILFVGGKNEARSTVKNAAIALRQPYVAGRWVGGTLTNFDEIRKRVNRLTDLEKGKEKGEHDKYTKHERLLIDREIEELEGRFGGIVSLEALPAALFVIDPKHEETAMKEAKTLKIPVIALASSDCDIREIAYPISANDTNIKSIDFFVNAITEAYKDGHK